jgi:hypothetical protein
MGGGEGLDDGQAKSVPVAVIGTDGAQPLEGLEKPVHLCGRDRGAAVGYREMMASLVAPFTRTG